MSRGPTIAAMHWRRWTIATTLGELLGFAVPALVGATLGALEVPQLPMAAGLVLAGAGEGAVLGAFQGRSLAPAVATDDVTAAKIRRDWTRATAAAAMIAWILGMTPSTVLDGDPSAVAPAVLIVGGVVLGLAFLLVMGVAQWLVLRRVVAGAWRWIAASALAWPLGVAVPVVALMAVPDGAPMAAHAVVGVLAGVAMGAVVGGITGRTLVRLLARPR